MRAKEFTSNHKQDVAEGDVPSDPNKLTASMLMGGEYKEFDLTSTMEKNNWVGTPKQVINQADKWLSDFLRQRGAMYSNLKLKYKGITMTSSKIGDVDASDLEFESIAEGIEQFCEVCGGSLAESGKASRKLCKSTKPASELGASQLSSCISQGFRARATEKKFTINRKRQKVKGKKVKGGNYGGPLPVWKGNQ